MDKTRTDAIEAMRSVQELRAYSLKLPPTPRRTVNKLVDDIVSEFEGMVFSKDCDGQVSSKVMIKATHAELNEFNSAFHLFQYGNSAAFDRVAHLAENGIDIDMLATLFWVWSDCDRETGIQDIKEKLVWWFKLDEAQA